MPHRDLNLDTLALHSVFTFLDDTARYRKLTRDESDVLFYSLKDFVDGYITLDEFRTKIR